MNKVKFFAPGECWEWGGCKNQAGYGQFRVKSGTRGMMVAHKFSYIIVNGPIKSKLVVCHSCDNPSCVNPEHLWLGTQQQNMLDSVKKNRHVHKKKTHCPQGHEYNDKNTRHYKGERNCRQCAKDRRANTIRNETESQRASRLKKQREATNRYLEKKRLT